MQNRTLTWHRNSMQSALSWKFIMHKTGMPLIWKVFVQRQTYCWDTRKTKFPMPLALTQRISEKHINQNFAKKLLTPLPSLKRIF